MIISNDKFTYLKPLKPRQTPAVGAGFPGVSILQPIPVTVTTRTRDPHGFVNPCHSLPTKDRFKLVFLSINFHVGSTEFSHSNKPKIINFG